MDILCKKSVIGAHDADRRGICIWCKKKVEAPVPRSNFLPVSNLTEAYEYFYDPDWGIEK